MGECNSPRWRTTALLLACCLSQSPVHCANTIGLIQNDAVSYPGYTLFSPIPYTATYLIDNQGRKCHTWSSTYKPGQSVYLLDNGNLLRPIASGTNPIFTSGGAAGGVEQYDWNGSLLWSYTYSSNQHLTHHDICPLPNGNLLMVAWELKTQSQALAAGRNPSLLTVNGLWPDHIIEVQPSLPSSGTIVWEWHAWDHLVQDFDSAKANYGIVANHPELIDLNFASNNSTDWLHTNSIDYNTSFDQIMISTHNLGEIWVIDHSTTTGQAASHTGGNRGKGGDLLYRWGNPQAYRAGTSADQKFYGQHNAQWIRSGLPGGGHILVFNNGMGRTGTLYSEVDEIAPPVDANGNYTLTPGTAAAPSAPTWSYAATPPASFYAQNISGAQRLPNGNTLICDGPNGIFFEVTSAGITVWKYINPVTSAGPQAQGTLPGSIANLVFRANRYPASSPAFSGHDLTPGPAIESPAAGISEWNEYGN